VVVVVVVVVIVVVPRGIVETVAIVLVRGEVALKGGDSEIASVVVVVVVVILP